MKTVTQIHALVFIPASSSVCQFALKCKATISLTRGDHTDIKMTKTRRQAGDSGAAHDMRGKQESGDELETLKGQISPKSRRCEGPERSSGWFGGLKVDLAPLRSSEESQPKCPR